MKNKTSITEQPCTLQSVKGSYLADKLMDIVENPKPLKKPPYKCLNTGDRRKGDGCIYPNCGCEWHL